VTLALQRKMLPTMLHYIAVAMLLVGRASETYAQANCVTADLMEAEGIVATCCESVDGGCESAFPATCTHTCASLVVRQTLWNPFSSACARLLPRVPSTTQVPYVDNCGSMLGVLGDSLFTSFSVGKLITFSDACRQTLVLYERAETAGSCGQAAENGDPSVAIKARVDSINLACCEQEGTNACTNGIYPPVTDDHVIWPQHRAKLQLSHCYLARQVHRSPATWSAPSVRDLPLCLLLHNTPGVKIIKYILRLELLVSKGSQRLESLPPCLRS
jgi:hypothetical protein